MIALSHVMIALSHASISFILFLNRDQIIVVKFELTIPTIYVDIKNKAILHQ